MTVRRSKALFSIYFANACGAVGHLLVLAVATHWIGLVGYGSLSLYLLAFAVPVALEPAMLRRGVDLQQDGAKHDVQAGFIVTWALAWLTLGMASAGLLAVLVFDRAPGIALSFALIATGFADYAGGAPLLSRIIRASAASRYEVLAKIALVQAVSRYVWIFGLLWLGEGDLRLLVLMPLRRVLEYAALRGLPGVIDGGRIALSRVGATNLAAALTKYGSIIGWLLLGTEGVGLLVYLHFGDAEFGRYRAIFDLASKAWFVATIFPLVLYPRIRLVERGPQLIRTMKKALSVSFVGYLVAALLGLGLAPWVFPIAFPALEGSERYLFGVLLGVAMVGHARLGLECLQAFGATRVAAALAAGFSLLLLVGFEALTAIIAVPVTVLVVAAWVLAGAVLAACVDERALAHAGASRGVRAEVAGWQLASLAVLLAGAAMLGALGARA